MDDEIKIYDTVRGNQCNQQYLYYNSVSANGYNTTNCAKLKKSTHWTNIFTWKKKTKQTPNSIINYPFVANSPQRFGGSMSAATGIAYSFAPPPGRLPPTAPLNGFSAPDIRQELITSTTTTTTTIHSSVRNNTANKDRQNRNSLFYSPWESFHDQSADQLPVDECTCHSTPIVDTYCSTEDKKKSLRGLSAKSVPMISSTTEPLYDSRRLSRMDLYSLEEENNYDKHMEFKSKSSDSLFETKKKPSNGLKNCRSSTTLNGIPFGLKSHKSNDTTSATVNERFLRFFKKSSTDPYNSIASRKSILECDVSAYDLIKQHLESELFEDDVDDSLSDNAIENENKVQNVGTGGTAAALNRKSKKTESNVKSGSESRHSSITASSVRIGGIGMNLLPLPAPKLKCNQNIINTKIYSTIDSNSESPSTSTWSASSGLSDDTFSLPEPDYDIDDPDYDTYTPAQVGEQSIECLKAPNSPPLPTNALNINENTTDFEIYAKKSSIVEKIYVKRCELKSNASLVSNGSTPKPYSDSPPPLPPPEPPAPTQRLTPTHNNVLKPKCLTPNANTFTNELKDKLNSGVKSILKKSPLISCEGLSKSENDITITTTSSESCDYLKTFKEFKESRLRSGRQRKHVHFKSQSHDRLISSQTILEVEESDEPIYDDVRLPGANSHSDDDSCGQQSVNDNAFNDCHKSEQLDVMSTESTISDNSITKSVSIDNDLDDKQMGTIAPVVKREGQLDFAEFDPSEDLSSSSSPTIKAQAAKARMNGIDLKPKHNSLTESHNRFSDNKNFKNSISNVESNGVNQDIRGTIDTTIPSPLANSKTLDPFTTGAEHKTISTNITNQLKASIAQRKYLPIVSPAKSSAPVAKPREEQMTDQQIGKQSTSRTAVAPQAQARVKSLTKSSGMTDRSSLSTKEKTNETIDEKFIPLLPVSRDNCVSNQSNNNNKKVFSDFNALRLEKQITNKFNNSFSNETEISNFNQNLTKLTDIETKGDNCLGLSSTPVYERINSAKCLQSVDQSMDKSKQNPYLCTISIKNGSNNSVINQTCIETNANICLTTNSMPFESIGSSISSSSLYDSGPQSSTDSITTERTQLLITNNRQEMPIPVFYANPNDKIVINVPSDEAFEQIEEHIYEELDTEPIYVDTDGSLENAKSIFDGASKDEILEFLEDAKERVGEDILVDQSIDTNIEILEAIDVIEELSSFPIDVTPIVNNKSLNETTILSSNRRNRTSNVSNSSTDSTATTSSSVDVEDDIIKCAITNSSSVGQLVERNDSGVGAETSKPSRLRKLSLNDEVEHQCADCEMHVDPNEDDETGLLHYPLFCHRCDKKRSERKEIISEIVDTEFKYGRDLRIIREEFYRPIEIAGLLSKEQLRGVFLNLDELIAVNSKFSEKLQDAIDIATEQGDEDFTTVNIGKLFRDSSSMLHSFEVYCVRQGSAALLLNHLEKEKELLRIFLRVSQMENTLLRRMNLRSFLVVPVQRVTKYPLLLNRLYKVTPYHHRDREALRESQQKVELHLEHINQQTKGTIGATTRIWRRISNLSTSHRRLNNADDIGNIKIRKAALEILKWNQEETQFVIIGKVLFTSITDYTINRKTKTLKFLTASALLVTLGRPNQNYRPDLVNNSDASKDLVFPRDNTGINDAVLLLIKEKCGRYVLCKEILNLKSCVISSETESDEMFEIHEQSTKESFLFKAETLNETKDWLKQLKYHSKDLGNWRRRRNALANIMMVRQ